MQYLSKKHVIDDESKIRHVMAKLKGSGFEQIATQAEDYKDGHTWEGFACKLKSLVKYIDSSAAKVAKCKAHKSTTTRGHQSDSNESDYCQ